ncbi:hypothetical protein AVEN_231558-1 [Araneus ventricosus]|uniref:Uncharacterized protein n=1 Tax=Araneus ventricosus TaxID=182803 RepID=A0A4Y2VQ46_ARAVE|nr:hypothetical protein AVEN_231558-1 [Araneus ventricosus]
MSIFALVKYISSFSSHFAADHGMEVICFSTQGHFAADHGMEVICFSTQGHFAADHGMEVLCFSTKGHFAADHGMEVICFSTQALLTNAPTDGNTNMPNAKCDATFHTRRVRCGTTIPFSLWNNLPVTCNHRSSKTTL